MKRRPSAAFFVQYHLSYIYNMLRSLLISGIICLTMWQTSKGQPAPPGAPAVIITEIFYDMPGVADSLEFIELTNPSDTNERSISFHSFTEGIEFTFPAGVFVEGGGVVIVAKDSVAFENAFGVEAFQWESGELSDVGELIVLRNNFNLPIDSVNYQTNMLWPEASGNGKSIVLCNDTQPNLGPENWEAATTNTGVVVDGVTIFANPGYSCANWTEVSEVPIQDWSIYPNPNNGAFEIQYSEQFSGPIDVSIADVNGKIALQKTVSASNSMSITVDHSLSSGLYFVSLKSKNTFNTLRLVIME